MHGVEEITATKKEARAKYREYRQALATNDLPWVREIKEAYNQLRRGHGIIDIFKAFKQAGVNADGDPRLAVFPAHLSRCIFRKEREGAGYIENVSRRRTREVHFPVGTFTWQNNQHGWPMRESISCPVPIVPPHLMPRAHLSNFHILWEVEKWNLEAPRDPLLLRRVSNNLFAVVAKWDLTELERAVVAGRIR